MADDLPDLIKRLRSGVIEWCRITHQGHVTDNTPYEAADALAGLLLAQKSADAAFDKGYNEALRDSRDMSWEDASG
jgi:hypothetical protein